VRGNMLSCAFLYVNVNQFVILPNECTVRHVCSILWSASCYCFLFASVLFESMRAFMYGHITIRDQANVVNIERLLFSLKKKGATKQMSIIDF
jgi:hypothetical protein